MKIKLPKRLEKIGEHVFYNTKNIVISSTSTMAKEYAEKEKIPFGD